jgi:hypothetical protein
MAAESFGARERKRGRGIQASRHEHDGGFHGFNWRLGDSVIP